MIDVRQSDYGDPDKMWERTAAIWSALLGVPVSPAQAALCMVAVKIAREAHKHKQDNIVDAIGYLKIVELLNES